MTWGHQDSDKPLKVSERRAEYAKELKVKVLEEEGKRKEAEAQLEMKGAEQEGARVELAVARAEMACFKAESSNYREDTLMEVSRLQARTKATKRKAVEAEEDVAAAKAIALSEYQSSAEFEQVYGEQ